MRFWGWPGWAGRSGGRRDRLGFDERPGRQAVQQRLEELHLPLSNDIALRTRERITVMYCVLLNYTSRAQSQLMRHGATTDIHVRLSNTGTARH